MNAQQIAWLPEEVRNHIAQLERDIARMEEYLSNSGRNMDEAQEQIAGRDSKIVTLSADLTRATAERQNWKEWAEEARAMFHKQIDAAAVMKTRAEQAEQRNAELVAALDDLLGCPTVTDLATCPNGDPSRIDEAPEWQAVLQISCAWTRYKKLKVLASAESATPDHIPDAAKMVSATPAKHPDTEIVDWLDAQFHGGDDWCRLFPLGNTIREAYAARKQGGEK